MNGISSAGIDTNGRIMSRSSCSRMWQWYMKPPGECLEAHDDVDDLVRVDPDGVLESELVVVEGVCGCHRPARRRACTVAPVCRVVIAVRRADRRSRVPIEHLERVEVDVDRVGVLGEVDEPPDLRLPSIGKNVTVSSKRVATVR